MIKQMNVSPGMKEEWAEELKMKMEGKVKQDGLDD